MRCIHALAVTATFLSTFTEGISLNKRTDGPSKVLGLPIQRSTTSDPLTRHRLRKRGTLQVNLDNEETLYFANVSIGTPAQTLRLHIDTGSSDLWVNTPNSALCSANARNCATAGTYSANSSSTYAYVGSWFNISYVDGSGASGDYVTDTLHIGGSDLAAQQFGIGYTSSSAEGILGIGYQINEVQVGRAGKTAYKNVPASMLANGMIATNAYSLWLNDLDANTGSILFGGVDTEKFHGNLATLPIQKTSGVYAEFLITMTGLAMGSTTIASKQAVPVLLDSGTSLTYLPNAMVSTIYATVNAQYDADEGAAFVLCSLASNTSTLDFTFSSPTISVPMDELVIPVYGSNGKQLTFTNGQKACLFGIAPAGSSTVVLGDTFLRSAYVVYDMTNNQISIAPTNFNSTTSNILEISAGTSGVPSATVVQNAATATAGSGGNSAITNGLSSATAASTLGAAGHIKASMSTVAIVGLVAALILIV